MLICLTRTSGKQFNNCLGIKPKYNCIPPIEKHGTLMFDDTEKAN